MKIGITRELASGERRVALTPGGVRRLVEAGHAVYFEHAAGERSFYPDDEYLQAGAKQVFSAAEVWGRADLVAKVAAPTKAEYELLHPEQIVMGFFHLAVSPREAYQILLKKQVTAIGFEVIESMDGNLPVLSAISEIAGQMTVPIASHLLETESGGRGILLGGAPGIPPALVVILGAGIVGTHATRTAVGAGAQVIVLDQEINKLRRIHNEFGNRVATAMADRPTIERLVKAADVLIGAVLIHGGKAPHLVSEEMVRTMKPGSVILDISIDQGGCVATSRPTTLAQPTFVYSGVIHYCVPNMTANIARTATAALSHSSLPYLMRIANEGIDRALYHSPDLAKGVYTYNGQCVNPVIAEIFGAKPVEIYSLLGEQIWS